MWSSRFQLFDYVRLVMNYSGIALIDDQHCRLLSMITQARHYIATPYEFDGLLTLLGKLDAYAESHFFDEEKIVSYARLKALRLPS